MEEPKPTETYEVRPTESSTNLSDAAMTTLFQTHVAICINSANLVWQRFNIMVAANAIILGFLVSKSDAITLFGALFGLLLCLFWYLLIAGEWDFFRQWMALSLRFVFPTLAGEANPHRYIHQHHIKSAGQAWWAARAIIILFAGMYALLFVWYVACPATSTQKAPSKVVQPK